MNHPFESNPDKAGKCKTCLRSVQDHFPNTPCDLCHKKFKAIQLEKLNDFNLCPDCKSDALESARGNGILPGAKVLDYEVKESEHIKKVADSMKSDLPAHATDIFNSKMQAISELEARILADPEIPQDKKYYFFTQQIQARQAHLYNCTIEMRELMVEVSTERNVNYRKLMEISSKLSIQEREQLNVKYAEYKIQTPPVKVSAPRRTADVKFLEGIAKLLFAPRNEKGIPQWESLSESDRQSCITKARAYQVNQLGMNKKS